MPSHLSSHTLFLFLSLPHNSSHLSLWIPLESEADVQVRTLETKAIGRRAKQLQLDTTEELLDVGLKIRNDPVTFFNFLNRGLKVLYRWGR